MKTIEGLGHRIRFARKRKGLTQMQLAELIGLETNVTISDYERGKRGNSRPDMLLIVKISEVLEVSIDWLILGRDQKSK